MKAAQHRQNPSNTPVITLIVLIILFFISVIAYNFWKAATISEQLSSYPAENIPPEGWTYRTNNECGVQFAIPPKTPPYYQAANPDRIPSVTEDSMSGRFWDFPRGGVYPNLITMFPAGSEYKQATAMFAAEGEASGYISAAVVVSCIPNDQHLSTQQMWDSLKMKLAAYTPTTEEGMGPSSYKVSAETETKRWNYSTFDVTLEEVYENSGGKPYANRNNYTVFATPQYVYEVRIMHSSPDENVLSAAQEIFQYLKFD